MKLDEMIAVLTRYRSFCKHGDEEHITLCVPVTSHYSSVGGQPFEEITSVSQGFDWDHGKLFFHTKTKLTPGSTATEKIKKRTMETAETIAYIDSIAKGVLGSKLTSDEKLAAIKSHCEAFRNRK